MFFSIGVKVMFFFSLSGVIFLSVIAFLLEKDSLYLVVNKENMEHKQKLAEGVIGAIFLYIGCGIISGYFWFKACSAIREDSRFD